MEQEVNLKTTCIVIQSSEKVGRVFYEALRKCVESQLADVNELARKSSTEKTNIKGKRLTVSELKKDGSDIEVINVGVDEMQTFQKYARKYGIYYSVEKDKAYNPPKYYIFFKAKDGSLVDKALNEYVSDKMLKNDQTKEESISDKLNVAKELTAGQVDKVKNKQQIR